MARAMAMATPMLAGGWAAPPSAAVAAFDVESASTDEVLDWALARFARQRIVATTSFGIEVLSLRNNPPVDFRLNGELCTVTVER